MTNNCSNCGSVHLYLVRQGEYSFKACKDCEHEEEQLKLKRGRFQDEDEEDEDEDDD